MEYKQLGKSELIASRIGFGCWAIGGHGYGKVDDQESIRSIHRALELGINFFDTADVYGFGHSEKILSKALGSKIKDVIIATKFGVKWNDLGVTTKDCSPQRLTYALEGSLRRLKLDCIPLYQIHWPDNKSNIDETIDALEKCRSEGKIKYYGCSNFSLGLIESLKKINYIVSQQTQYSIMDRQNDGLILKCNTQYKIANIVYGVLARGFLSGKYSLNTQYHDNDTRKTDINFQGERFNKNIKMVEYLKLISLKYGTSSSQVAIRWILQKIGIDFVLIGIRNSKQIEENVKVFNWELSQSDYTDIENWILN